MEYLHLVVAEVKEEVEGGCTTIEANDDYGFQWRGGIKISNMLWFSMLGFLVEFSLNSDCGFFLFFFRVI